MKIPSISDTIDLICREFSAEGYAVAANAPAKHRFPSFVSAGFRYVLRKWFIALPLIWVVMLILCIAEGLPFVGVIVASILGAVLCAVLLIALFMFVMALESIAKHITSLILHGALADGAENPIDAFVSFILRGE